MKKLYTLIAATAIVVSASAQRSNMNNPANKLDGFTPKIVPTTSATRAAGDTLFYFDGEGFYGLGIDGTFDYALDDADGKTIWTAGQTSFGVTGSFTFFYELLPTPGDTNIYMAATSYFTPVGQADNWFEFGPVAIPASGATFSWGAVYNDPAYRDGYQMLVSQTGLVNYNDFIDPAIWTVASNAPSTAVDTFQTPNNIFVTKSVDLSAYAGQSIYLALQHNAIDMFIVNWDNFLITENAVGVNVTEFTNGAKVSQNMPNPFNSVSTISYELEKAANISLSVYDVTGKKVASQSEGTQSAGTHVISFNGADLAAGVYYYSLQVGESTTSAMKMVIVK